MRTPEHRLPDKRLAKPERREHPLPEPGLRQRDPLRTGSPAAAARARGSAWKLAGTYLIVLSLVGLLALFVWGWYRGQRAIPEVVFGGLLGLIGTLLGYVWRRDPQRE